MKPENIRSTEYTEITKVRTGQETEKSFHGDTGNAGTESIKSELRRPELIPLTLNSVGSDSVGSDSVIPVSPWKSCP